MKKTIIETEQFMTYWNRQLSIKEMADVFGCSTSVIRKKLKELNIPCNRSAMMSRRYGIMHNALWNDVKQLLDSGLSVDAISKKLPISSESIKKLIEEHNYCYTYTKMNLTLRSDEYKMQLEELLKNHTIKEMSKILGIPERTLSRHLCQFGLTKSSARVDIKDEDVLHFWQQGMSINDIAKKFDCSHGTITKRLKKYGVEWTRKNGIERHFEYNHDVNWDYIKADLDKCIPVSVVAIRNKLRYETVYRLMEKHNYKYYGLQELDLNALQARLENGHGDEIQYLEAIKKYYEIYGNAPVIYTLSRMFDVDMKKMREIAVRYDLMPFLGNSGPSVKVLKIAHDLDELGISYEFNNREILSNNGTKLEMDIYLLDYKLGIEVNPTWTHSVDTLPYGQADKNYHQMKALVAEKCGVGLVHLYDTDFIDETKYAVFLKQLSCLPKQKMKIGARQCCVKNIDRSTANLLLDEFHFQGGEHSSTYRYGMFWNDILVGVFTVGESRFSNGYWEIVRYCMNPNYIVIGCFEKFLKTFLKEMPVKKPVLAYMDLNKRLIASNVYEKHGFVSDGATVPDYVWINQSGTQYFSRYSVTKKRLVEQGFDFDKSEIEIMRDRKFCRVYGAGSKRYILDV